MDFETTGAETAVSSPDTGIAVEADVQGYSDTAESTPAVETQPAAEVKSSIQDTQVNDQLAGIRQELDRVRELKRQQEAALKERDDMIATMKAIMSEREAEASYDDFSNDGTLSKQEVERIIEQRLSGIQENMRLQQIKAQEAVVAQKYSDYNDATLVLQHAVQTNPAEFGWMAEAVNKAPNPAEAAYRLAKTLPFYTENNQMKADSVASRIQAQQAMAPTLSQVGGPGMQTPSFEDQIKNMSDAEFDQWLATRMSGR